MNNKYLVALWVDAGRDAMKRMAYQIAGEIESHGISVIMNHQFGRMLISTRNIDILVMNHKQHLLGIRFDEAFNIPKEFIQHVHLKDPEKYIHCENAGRKNFHDDLMRFVLMHEVNRIIKKGDY